MRTTEYYTKEYLYDAGDMRTGLSFATNHQEGFLYGSMYSKKKEGESDDRLNTIFQQSEVQYGSVSEEAAEYILRECRRILKNEPSAWRINYIEPKPDEITLQLVLKNEDEELPDQELVDELLENALQVTIDIRGGDVQEEGRHGGIVKLELKCQDAYNSKGISRLSIHVCHNSKAECAWEKERAYIKIEQTDGNHYYERYVTLRWKNKKRGRMIAEIKEIY